MSELDDTILEMRAKMVFEASRRSARDAPERVSGALPTLLDVPVGAPNVTPKTGERAVIMTGEQREWYERGRRDAWSYAARHLPREKSWIASWLSWRHRLKCWLRGLAEGDAKPCDHWDCNGWRDEGPRR